MKKESKIETDLINALETLMYEIPYEDISIKQIIVTAKVARCTFYRHYKNKEDLLNRLCQVIIHDFSTELFDKGWETLYDTAIAYFSFWKTHRDFIEMLRRNKLLYYFLDNYDNLMFNVSKEVKYNDDELDGFSFSPKIRYHFFFGMNGLWGIANRWLMYGCKESPEELTQYIIAYIVESYEIEPDCQYYEKNKKYPYVPCFIKTGYEK